MIGEPFRIGPLTVNGSAEQYDALMSVLLGETLEVYQARNRELRRRIDLLQRPVVITLSTRPTVQVVGQLMDFTDDGDVSWKNAEGKIRHGWPMLDVQPRPAG